MCACSTALPSSGVFGGAANLPALDSSPPLQFIVSFRQTMPMQSDETKFASQ
jgi:hypothetical protein